MEKIKFDTQLYNLNAVFNWVDSIKHVEKYKKKFNKIKLVFCKI